MIRDVTGLNEARDGSLPDKQSLVGLQKLAAANSNVATRHILQAGMYLTLKTCENITLRAADSLMYPLTKQALESSISKFNVGTLDELINLNTHDFGIFLQLEPDEEQKAMLEENIQIALKSGQIYLEDAIDIREVKNIQLANAVLKQRRKRKQAQDQQAQQANIQAQANANAEAAERSALAETQKQQVISEQNINYEQAKNQFSIDKMMQEAEVEKEKMRIKFGYDMQLKQMDLQEIASREKFIEDRKDKRTRIVGSQQSQMIDQRQNDLLPTNFEQDGDNPMEGLV
jgi:regulator of protease activity HflC (stomatin/prohibitin superfamily)